jgi:hypothetical protein
MRRNCCPIIIFKILVRVRMMTMHILPLLRVRQWIHKRLGIPHNDPYMYLWWNITWRVVPEMPLARRRSSSWKWHPRNSQPRVSWFWSEIGSRFMLRGSDGPLDRESYPASEWEAASYPPHCSWRMAEQPHLTQYQVHLLNRIYFRNINISIWMSWLSHKYPMYMSVSLYDI